MGHYLTNPNVIIHFCLGIIYLWIYLRLHTFLKINTTNKVNFVSYFTRSCGFMSLYIFFIVSATVFFRNYPMVLGFAHWLSDSLIYIGVSQIIISIFILTLPGLYYRLKSIVYVLTFILIFIHFYFHLQPGARHEALLDWAVITTIMIPHWVNFLPYLLWAIGYFVIGSIFLYLSLSAKNAFVRKRSLMLSIATMLFSLSYPLSRVLYLVNLPSLPPLFSFIAGVIGLYVLTSTSCLLGIYSLLSKKPTKIQPKGQVIN